MARRALAGRDLKIIQGQRRDEFFARMRRRGGVPRMPTQAGASSGEQTAVDSAADEAPEGSSALSDEGATVGGETTEGTTTA